MNKVAEFLKKLWCCIGGRFLKDNWILSTELMVKIGHRKEFHKLFIRQNEWQRANARSVSLKNCLGNGVT